MVHGPDRDPPGTCGIPDTVNAEAHATTLWTYNGGRRVRFVMRYEPIVTVSWAITVQAHAQVFKRCSALLVLAESKTVLKGLISSRI